MDRKQTQKSAVLALRPDAKLAPARLFSGAKTYRISVPEGWLCDECSTPFAAWTASLSSLGGGE